MNVYVALDIISAVLTALVVISFLRLWRLSRSPTHLLAATGFALLALGMVFVSASVYDDNALPRREDYLRIIFHTSAALVLVFTYAAAQRDGIARPAVVLGATVATLALLAAVLATIFPGYVGASDLHTLLLVTHVVQFLCYLWTAVFVIREQAPNLTLDRLLVPSGFLSYAASKYTWIIIDATSALKLVPLIYVWRFLTIALLLVALRWPARSTTPPSGLHL